MPVNQFNCYQVNGVNVIALIPFDAIQIMYLTKKINSIYYKNKYKTKIENDKQCN